MVPETIGALVSRVREIESDVTSLRRCIEGEDLATSDRQYLSRCFDLLDMELVALRQYVNGLQS